MNPKEYIALQRAYNTVRQNELKIERLGMHDLSLLAHIRLSNMPKTIQELAKYCGMQVPTISVRTRRLVIKGLLEKKEDKMDKRRVMCMLTSKGTRHLDTVLMMVCDELKKPDPLYKASPKRLEDYFSAMGTVELTTKDLILLILYLSSSVRMNIVKMSKLTRMLEPTVSFAVSQLDKLKMLTKEREEFPQRRDVNLILTEKGKKTAEEFLKQVKNIVVKRPKK